MYAVVPGTLKGGSKDAGSQGRTQNCMALCRARELDSVISDGNGNMSRNPQYGPEAFEALRLGSGIATEAGDIFDKVNATIILFRPPCSAAIAMLNKFDLTWLLLLHAHLQCGNVG